jgi:hypothetical protein
MKHQVAMYVRQYGQYVAFAVLGYLALAYLFKLPPFLPPPPPPQEPERRLVLILDCSNNKLLASEVNAIVGESPDDVTGIAGDFLNDWKDKSGRRPWEIDIAYVNDKSETNSLKKVVLNPLSGSKADIEEDFEKVVKEVRRRLEFDPGRGEGTQIIRTLSSVMSKLPIDKEDHTLKVAVVSNFLEQDKELDIDMAGLSKTPTVYNAKAHDKFDKMLKDAIDKYGNMDLHDSEVHLYLTKSDRSRGVHKAVLEKLWKSALENKNSLSVDMDVLQ